MIRLQNTKTVAILILMFVVLGPTTVRGQGDAQTSQEAAIRQAGAAYVQALRKRDVAAAAAAWTANGMYADANGRLSKARELIQKQLRQTAAAGTSNGEVQIDSKIRFVTKDVAIEDGTHTSAGVAGRFTATWVKQGERWLLDHLVEHATVPDSPAGRLEALSWMVGDWFGQGDGYSILCNADWSENRKFIVRKFFVEKDGKHVLSGEQRIGWHPGVKAIRSWGFDSNGGIVEGRWRQEGEAWIVRNSGVATNGKPSSSISFWLQEGEDRCALRTSHAVAGEAKVKDAVVEFSRLKSGN